MLKVDFDIDIFTTYIAFVLGILLLIYIFWDINYFIRTIFTITVGRIFQEELKVDDTCIIYGKHFFCLVILGLELQTSSGVDYCIKIFWKFIERYENRARCFKIISSLK